MHDCFDIILYKNPLKQVHFECIWKRFITYTSIEQEENFKTNGLSSIFLCFLVEMRRK